MKRIIPFLACVVCFNSFLISQTYYTAYDEKCLDRYEFITDADRTPYVVYTSKVTGGRVLQFDVGKENETWVKNLPGKLTECSLLSFDKAMALAINNSSIDLYMVRESPTHYNVSKVEKATLIESNGERLSVTMADADFTLNYNRLTTHDNLATPASRKDIFLEGTVKYQCMTGYMFKKMDAGQAQSYKEYTIVPGFGIVNKRSLPHAGAATNSLRLDRVNHITFVEFATEMCKSIETTPAAVVEKKAEKAAEIYETAVDKKLPVSNTTNLCNKPAKDGVHYVQKGETVYSISRSYGISVDNIKVWNNLSNTNVINICQPLFVKTPNSISVSTQDGVKEISTPTTEPINTSQFHIVKPNETVQQIAEMYGYTESRFRTMNSLGIYERVYAGQKLYTSDCNCPSNDGVGTDAALPYDNVEVEKLTQSGSPDVYFRPIKVHLVKPNETLFAIARQYDTTVDRIRELNGLEKNAQLNKDQRIYVQ